jgi:hypothetical protein
LLPLEQKTLQKKQNLAVPEGYRYYTDDIQQFHHERVPEDKKKMYFKKLFSLFSKVPKAKTLTDSLGNCKLTCKDCFLEKSKANNELRSIHDLCIQHVVGASEPSSSSSVRPRLTIEDDIYTLSVFNALSKRFEQQIEFLGTSSLSDVKDMVYCVQDKVNEEEETKDFFFKFQKKFITDRSSHQQSVTDIIRWLSASSTEASQITAGLYSSNYFS